MQHLLRDKNIDLSRSYEFDELYDEVCSNGLFRPYLWIKPKLCSSAVQQKFIEGIIEEALKEDTTSEKFQLLNKKRFILLEKLISDKVTQHPDTKILVLFALRGNFTQSCRKSPLG